MLLCVLLLLLSAEKEEDEKMCVDRTTNEIVSCEENNTAQFSRVYCMKPRKHATRVPVGYDAEYTVTTVSFNQRGCVGVKCISGCVVVKQEGDACCMFSTAIDVMTRGRGSLLITYKRDLWFIYALYGVGALLFVVFILLTLRCCCCKRDESEGEEGSPVTAQSVDDEQFACGSLSAGTDLPNPYKI